MKNIPSRFDLLALYTSIQKALTEKGINPKEIVVGRRTALYIPDGGQEIISDHLNQFPFEEQIYLRVMNDQQRFFLSDELVNIAMVMNEQLPRLRDLENKERETYREIPKLEGETLMSAEDLVFGHMCNETPAYLRRLFTGSINAKDYQMEHTIRDPKAIEAMELISVDWLLSREPHDREALRILSLVNNRGQSMEMRQNNEPRFRFLQDIMPSLTHLTSFKRSETSSFARFVFQLPTVISWVLGNYSDKLSPEQEDPLMELLETTMTFTRVLQANADKAANLRQKVHHGFPVYKELLELSRAQSQLLTWNFESIIFRLSYNFKSICADRSNAEPTLRMLVQTGILDSYAKHKGAYIKR